MAKVTLNAGSCLLSHSLESECRKCEVICPTNAIVIADNPLPYINNLECVTCGACSGVCPTEALNLDTFSAKEFFFTFLDDSTSNLISCRKNVPCITVFSVEHIISLAILKRSVVFDTGYCAECVISSSCYPQIIKNYEEASYLLEAMQESATLELQNISYRDEKESDRREFLTSLNLTTSAKVKRNIECELQSAREILDAHRVKKVDTLLLRKKSLPQKREILFSAIRGVERPSVFHRVEADEVSFTSQKKIDKTLCNACQNCYRVCPTGALSSDITNSKIEFDPFFCIKCNLCHEICEPNAISSLTTYNIKEFFEPEVQRVIEFKVLRCQECEMIFSTNSDERVCSRCKSNQ